MKEAERKLENPDRSQILFAYIVDLSKQQNEEPRNFKQEEILVQRFNLDMEGLMKGNVDTHYFIGKIVCDMKKTIHESDNPISIAKDVNGKTYETFLDLGLGQDDNGKHFLTIFGKQDFFGLVRGDKASIAGRIKENVSGLSDKWYLYIGHIGQDQKQFFIPLSIIEQIGISSISRGEGFEAFCKK